MTHEPIMLDCGHFQRPGIVEEGYCIACGLANAREELSAEVAAMRASTDSEVIYGLTQEIDYWLAIVELHDNLLARAS